MSEYTPSYDVMFWVHFMASFMLVIACWWLAHVNANSKEVLGRTVALLYALFSLFIASTAFTRFTVMYPRLIDWLLIGDKLVLITLFMFVGVRREFLEKQKLRPHEPVVSWRFLTYKVWWRRDQ